MGSSTRRRTRCICRPDRGVRAAGAASGNSEPLRLVAARQYRLPPAAFRDIPFDRSFYSRFKILLGAPADFAFQFRRIDCITQVMAGPVVDEFNQLAPRPLVGGPNAIEDVAHGMNDLQVGALVSSADIVGVA